MPEGLFWEPLWCLAIYRANSAAHCSARQAALEDVPHVGARALSVCWLAIHFIRCSAPVTVQLLTKKPRFSGDRCKLRINFFPLSPFPFPRVARGKGKLFCGFLQAGGARLQKTFIFFSPPQRRILRWGGAKATDYKGPSIAV